MTSSGRDRLTLEFPRSSSRLSPEWRRDLARIFSDSLADGFPAGVSLAVVDSDGTLVRAWHGAAEVTPDERPMESDTLFDLASLTKVVATTTLATWLEQEGHWRLSDPVTRWVKDCDTGALTLLDLLAHRSGIIAHRAFFELGRRPAAIRRAVLADARHAHRSSKVVYSDLNFMLLGWAIEACTGEGLDRIFHRLVAAPLGMNDTMFRLPARLRTRSAATELDSDQRLTPGLVRGEVHDGNAWALGGVAGHAGLFSTVDDLSLFVSGLLDPRRGVLSSASVARMSRCRARSGDEVRATGWRLEPRGWGPWPSATLWHTGFTGTSLLVAPRADLAVVLLTNAIHPQRDLARQARYRAALHRVVAKVLS